MPAIFTALLYSIIFLFGIVIGSFLNVCIFRIPEKESIVFPGSHCMGCGHRLGWQDLVPLFSYILQKGRCRYCGARISVQYPLVEFCNGILYVTIFMANGLTPDSILFCLMASALLVISVIDERTFEIPVGLNLFLAVLGIIACVLDRQHLMSHLIGFVCVSLVLYVLFLATAGRAIGGGDVKLMAAAGLIIGWKKITLAFFLACILGAVIHSVRMKVGDGERQLAMGPYLSASIFICALWGDRMIEWYLGLIGLS